MEEHVFNDTLSLTFPEGFHLMDDAGRRALNMTEDGPGACFQDPGRHILISFGWKPLNALTSLLLSARDAEKNMEASIRKPMSAFEYHAGQRVSVSVGGEKAEGFCYTYKVQDTDMSASSLVVKHRKVFYYLHLYVRTVCKDEGFAIWEDILSHARWL